jgi:hypothetical protein
LKEISKFGVLLSRQRPSQMPTFTKKIAKTLSRQEVSAILFCKFIFSKAKMQSRKIAKFSLKSFCD